MTYETPPPRDSVPHMPGDPKECREDRGAINFPLDFVTGRAKFETAGPRERDAIQRKPAMLAEGLRDRAVLPETGPYTLPDRVSRRRCRRAGAAHLLLLPCLGDRCPVGLRWLRERIARPASSVLREDCLAAPAATWAMAWAEGANDEIIFSNQPILSDFLRQILRHSSLVGVRAPMRRSRTFARRPVLSGKLALRSRPRSPLDRLAPEPAGDE
jgi:hypothetical protein